MTFSFLYFNAMVLNKFLILCFFLIKVKALWQLDRNNQYPAFDPKFYQAVLDPEECEKQLDFIQDNLLLRSLFLDASANIPKAIMDGNLIDLGNYHQCLSIAYNEDEMEITGKYSLIIFDALHVIRFLNGQENKLNETKLNNKYESLSYVYIMKKIKENYGAKPKKREDNSEFDMNVSKGNITDIIENLPTNLKLIANLGMCIPKPCTSQQALKSSHGKIFDQKVTHMSSNETVFHKQLFAEAFCRLPNDKPWTPADTIATVTFSIIGVLTLICTIYDVIQKFIIKTDHKFSNLRIFSAYTNGCRLVNFSSSNKLQCIDGVRVLSTFWVILGHSAVNVGKYYNAVGVATWAETSESMYISSAPLAVDTFFTMSGLLLVYNICAKIDDKCQFIRNLPMFYLNRYLRLFPLLVTVILLQASFFHRISDGPIWTKVATATEDCRMAWWITLLNLQNLVENMKCISSAWYIAIDYHLHIISPVVLFWLFGSKKTAWIALTSSFLTAFIISAIYIFQYNFLVSGTPKDAFKIDEYEHLYYTNTLTRASPFFVGMIFGYLLHIYRIKRIHLAWHPVAFFWILSFASFLSSPPLIYLVRKESWDHQVIDNLLNLFMRPVWGFGIGWMVFACEQGYGGPVNWILSQKMWSLPARLCYGAYLLHVPIIDVYSDSMTTLDYYSRGKFTFLFIAFTSIVFLLSYIATVLIDAPCTTICKLIFETKKKKESTKL